MVDHLGQNGAGTKQQRQVDRVSWRCLRADLVDELGDASRSRHPSRIGVRPSPERAGRVELERFLDQMLAPLLAWDTRRNTELARTLLTYFDCSRSAPAAASALHIHPNTLRQRLDKVTTLIPGWNEPTRALDLHLALGLHVLRDKLAVQPAAQP